MHLREWKRWSRAKIYKGGRGSGMWWKREMRVIGEYVIFDYYNSQKTHGKKRAILLLDVGDSVKELEPDFIRRTRTGVHGFDGYSIGIYNLADALILIDVTNGGKHRCKVEFVKPHLKNLVKEWLKENEHLCPNLSNQLM